MGIALPFEESFVVKHPEPTVVGTIMRETIRWNNYESYFDQWWFRQEEEMWEVKVMKRDPTHWGKR